jgi:hypothetical protein
LGRFWRGRNGLYYLRNDTADADYFLEEFDRIAKKVLFRLNYLDGRKKKVISDRV